MGAMATLCLSVDTNAIPRNQDAPNGNDNASETDNDNNIEDNINEAASEDSGMSSVDNHNMSGGKMSEKCLLSAVYCQYNVT